MGLAKFYSSKIELQIPVQTEVGTTMCGIMLSSQHSCHVLYTHYVLCRYFRDFGLGGKIHEGL